jgi:YHS domain-containing protein
MADGGGGRGISRPLSGIRWPPCDKGRYRRRPRHRRSPRRRLVRKFRQRRLPGRGTPPVPARCFAAEPHVRRSARRPGARARPVDVQESGEPVSVYERVLARGPELPTNPVCRMAIDPERAAARRLHSGVEYFFCSDRCAATFEREPRNVRRREALVVGRPFRRYRRVRRSRRRLPPGEITHRGRRRALRIADAA